MLNQALKLFTLWRRNDWKSIAFKATLWGSVAWLLVGIFTSLRTAIIAGVAMALTRAIVYSLKRRKQNELLLKFVENDQNKFRGLRRSIDNGDAGAMLIAESIFAEDEADDDGEVHEPLDDETRARITAQFNAQMDAFELVLKQENMLDEGDAADCREQLIESIDEHNTELSAQNLIETYLPGHILGFEELHAAGEDEHATYLCELAEASGGRFDPEPCHSWHDKDSNRWVVDYTVKGRKRSLRFAQRGHDIPGKVFQAMVQVVEEESGCRIRVLENEDWLVLSCLPPAVDAHLFPPEGIEQAA